MYTYEKNLEKLTMLNPNQLITLLKKDFPNLIFGRHANAFFQNLRKYLPPPPKNLKIHTTKLCPYFSLKKTSFKC